MKCLVIIVVTNLSIFTFGFSQVKLLESCNQFFFPSDSSLINQRLCKRSVKPGTIIFGAGISYFSAPLIFEKPNSLFVLTNNHLMSLKRNRNFYVNFEYTLKRNFGFDVSLGYNKHFNALQFHHGMIRESKMPISYSIFRTINSDIGICYRVTGTNNLRLLDIRAGLTIGYVDSPKNQKYSSSFFELYMCNNDQIGVVQGVWEAEVLKTVYFNFYLSISKDVRITENLFAFGRYQHNFGRRTKISQHLVNYEASTYGINDLSVAHITAKTHIFSYGLRWYFR